MIFMTGGGCDYDGTYAVIVVVAIIVVIGAPYSNASDQNLYNAAMRRPSYSAPCFC